MAALVTAGAVIDGPVARCVHREGLDAKAARHAGRRTADRLLKLPGQYLTTAAVAVALGLLHPWRWKAAVLVVIAGAASSINVPLKWAVGRQRPITDLSPAHFHPFVGGFAGLLHEHNLSFPSGHTCLAFATAGAVAVCLPRWRWPGYVVAAAVGAERVLENAHFVSDVVGAAALGLLVAHVTARVLARYLPADARGGALGIHAATP